MTVVDWLPGYARQPFDTGLDWTPGTPWKAGIHSTETAPGSSQVIIDAWRKNPSSGLSHFIMNKPGQIIQLLPLSVGGFTAQNPAGGIDTNRAHLVQIEVCNYAINPDMPIGGGAPGMRLDWGDDWYDSVALWLADLTFAGCDLDLTTELVFGDHWVGFPGGGDAYVVFNGVLGHQHIPEQPDRHWDPGELDIRKLLAKARTYQTPINPGDLTVADIKEIMDAIAALSAKVDQDHIDTRLYITPRCVKVVGAPDQYLIVQTDDGLGRQHLSGELKAVLGKAFVASTLGKELGVDFVELSDPGEVAAFLALPTC